MAIDVAKKSDNKNKKADVKETKKEIKFQPEPKKESPKPAGGGKDAQGGSSPQGSPNEKKGKKGKKGKKSSKNKRMTLLFFVNGRADTTPFQESNVKTGTLNDIMQTNLHGEWEYRSQFICNIDGSLLKDPHQKITKSMPFVMVPRSESFKHAYYRRKFNDYMTELRRSKRKTCWA